MTIGRFDDGLSLLIVILLILIQLEARCLFTQTLSAAVRKCHTLWFSGHRLALFSQKKSPRETSTRGSSLATMRAGTRAAHRAIACLSSAPCRTCCSQTQPGYAHA